MSGKEYRRYRSGKTSEIERLELQARTLGDSVQRQISLLGIQNSTRVLDAGCGTGSFARNVAKVVLPAKITAVDIEPIFIEEARRLASEEGIGNIEFEVANLENLRFADGTFDISWMCLVLPYLKDASKAVAELKRITKRRGKIASFDEGGLFTYPPIMKFFDL